MTTIKKILCAVDLTKASRNAFDRALGIAGASKVRLYVLHAVPASLPFSWQGLAITFGWSLPVFRETTKRERWKIERKDAARD